MTTIIDIAVKYDEDKGYYDEYYESDGRLAEEYGWDTSLLMDFFTNQRASEEEVLDPMRRDGWIGNETPAIEGYEVGSKFHVYRTGRATQDQKNKLVDVMRDAYAHNVPEYWKDYTVTGTLEKQGVSTSLEITRKDNEKEDRHFQLWDFTGD